MKKNKLLVQLSQPVDYRKLSIPKRQSGSAKRQRKNALLIKNLRQIALIPFCNKNAVIEV